jgi:O-antigen/teichoic acid export membrane protein
VNVKAKAARGGAWFAATSFIGQGISWVFTFYVIRILNPDDFGLMSMASLFTAYLQMFSELGIGAAIIQRSDINQQSLSSVFWLTLAVGTTMGLATFGLAYPTAWTFSNLELIPVTQFISVLFLITALGTVPYHLLARQFEFKKIGIINIVATVVSSTISVYLALNGYGVYTLIWTTIALNGTKTLLYFIFSQWRPSVHFSFAEVKPFLSYGIIMALSSTSQRMFETLDRLVIGRFFGAHQLGSYANAMTISNMPLDKIWPVFNQILFPLLSRLRDDKKECIEVYLGTLTNYLLIVTPIYLGSSIVADDLVLVILGEKWLALAPLFKIFCFVKLLHVLTAYHMVLEYTSGRQRSAMWLNFVAAVLIPGSMWFGAQHSFDTSIAAWYTVYPLLCLSWLVWSVRKHGMALISYGTAIFKGSIAAVTMFGVLLAITQLEQYALLPAGLYRLLLTIGAGGLIFIVFIGLFQRAQIKGAIQALVKNR